MVLKAQDREQVETHGRKPAATQICVLWIDWYAYHVARFKALCDSKLLRGQVQGVEMVGGVGVHTGLKFREPLPASLPVTSLFAEGNWTELSKWSISRAIWRTLNKTNPSTIFVPGYYNLPALTAAAWGRLHGKKTVLMTESTEADHPRQAFREKFKSMLVRGLFTWAIAGGTPHARYLKKLGFPEARTGRFYDVVDNRFFREQAAQDRQRHTAQDFRLPANYFLFVGRLAEEKNVLGLLNSYIAYRQRGGTWSLVLVGDGPLKATLQAAAQGSTFADDILFEGLRNTQELSPYYAFAGCFVLPSSREPWGLVVNEAMASGLPVIVSRQCGCAEDLVADGKNGFIFDAADGTQLTTSMEQMSHLTPVERQAMALRSQEIISQYSPEQWAEEVARIAYA